MRPTGIRGGEGRPIRRTKKGGNGGGRTRPKATEEVSGTSFAFFEPADTGTKGSARSFLHQAVVELASEGQSIKSCLLVGDITSHATISRVELAFNATTIRLSATSSNHGEILGVRSGNVFGGVPERWRAIGKETSDGGRLKGRIGEEESVKPPQKRWGSEGRGKDNLNSVMVAERAGVNRGRRDKRGVACMNKKMI
jgi:hypothetical protein